MSALTEAEMRHARLSRDSAYNGLFIFAVRTTGVFCRPTCPARKPAPQNVEYFANPAAALAAGYRPCKRCRPLDGDERPAWAKRLLAQLDNNPAARIDDRALAARGVDPATVRRFFRRNYGMTFQAYARGRRLADAQARLQNGDSLDAAVLGSGYESHSGFRDAFGRLFGTTPGSRPAQACVHLSWLPSPIGPLVVGATSEGVCLLEFSDRERLAGQLDRVRQAFGMPALPGANEHLKTLEAELADYFVGRLRRFTVPLVYPGTEFRRRVWSELLKIPYGETCSYEDLAVAVGVPHASRAVGSANGANRIAIVIPCHRVVNKGGKIGGYGGGLRRKQFLLDLERQFRSDTDAPDHVVHSGVTDPPRRATKPHR